MLRTFGVAVIVAGATAAAVSAAGVLKTRFTFDGLFITAGSKTTGNGNSVTVCDYFDAETGAYLGQVQEAVGFDDEVALQQFCISLAPAQ